MNKIFFSKILILALPLTTISCAQVQPTVNSTPTAIPHSISTSYNGYKYFIPVGKEVKVLLLKNSTAEIWITVTKGQKVLITVDSQDVAISLVDNQGATVIGENGRLIARQSQGAVFITEYNGVYGIVLQNTKQVDIPVVLKTQVITK